MNEKPCALCKGVKWIQTIKDGEIEDRQCRCLKREELLKWVGSEIASAKHQKSDLYLTELDPETGQIYGDRTLENLFLKGLWTEVAAHLRFALTAKKYIKEGFTFRMVNDERLLRVYLSDYAYNRRSRSVRDDVETFNNLGDLISGLDLLIVRLGQLGYRNRAAPDVLQEALNLRASEAKATWLVEGDQSYFGEGHLFYSLAVGQYVQEHFAVVDLGGDVKSAIETNKALAEIGPDMEPPRVESVEMFVAPPKSERRSKSTPPWKKKPKGFQDGF